MTPASQQRFSVTLEVDQYKALKVLAESHRPRLTLQYLVQYAVGDLLKRSKDPRFAGEIGDPVSREEARD